MPGVIYAEFHIHVLHAECHYVENTLAYYNSVKITAAKSL